MLGLENNACSLISYGIHSDVCGEWKFICGSFNDTSIGSDLHTRMLVGA
jgi:hypothetical protein